jgi:hypothetical protein
MNASSRGSRRETDEQPLYALVTAARDLHTSDERWGAAALPMTISIVGTSDVLKDEL